MRFTKMQGLGNDYIYLNCLDEIPDHLSDLAVRLSDRHFGVGADGLICICSSHVADFKMKMFNADGSEGEMCGNGIRCMAKFVRDKGLTARENMTIETGCGLKSLTIASEGAGETWVTVDMGRPEPEKTCLLEILGLPWHVTPVSMGNPHGVVFCDQIHQLNLMELGPQFECHPRFPNRVNTEFVQTLGWDELKMRVWERGSGETLACGTGACAALVAAVLAGRCGRRAVVHLRGGDLDIEWDEETGRVFMTGPAVTVFEGDV